MTKYNLNELPLPKTARSVMETCFTRVKRFLADESAAAMVEYALMLAMISLVCVFAITSTGNELKDIFEELQEMLAGFF